MIFSVNVGFAPRLSPAPFKSPMTPFRDSTPRDIPISSKLFDLLTVRSGERCSNAPYVRGDLREDHLSTGIPPHQGLAAGVRIMIRMTTLRIPQCSRARSG